MGFSLFGLSGVDLAIGGLTTALSFIPGVGTAASMVIGGAAAAVQAKLAGKDWDEALEQGLIVGAASGLGGRLVGNAVLGLARGAGGRLATRGLTAGATWIRQVPWGMTSARALGRGLAAAYANAGYNAFTSSKPAGVSVSELPIEPISQSSRSGDSSLKIHEMWMPSRDQMMEPNNAQKYAQYLPLQPTIDWYRQLPATFQGYFDSCGNGKENKGTPPEMPKPPQVKGADLANFTNYGSTATSLRRAAALIDDSAKAIAPKAKATEAISVAAQKAVNDGIDLITDSAPTLPKGMKEDQHIYEFCNQAIQAVADALKNATNANNANANGLDQETAKLKELEEKIKQLQQANAALQQGDTAAVRQISTTPPGPDPNPVTPIDDGSKVPGLDNLAGSDTSNTPGSYTGTTPTGESLDDKVQRALGDLNNSATNPITATPASVPNTPAATPVNTGGGADLMNSVLPLLLGPMMNRSTADTDLNGRRGGYDPYEDQIRAVPAAVAPVQPAVQPAATTPVSPTNTAPPASPSSTQPTTGMPGRTPNSDGTVVYTFPDGRTQKVSVTVAQALDAAFGNASGTDAQAAYAKTPARWSDKKQIGTSIDPYQLMTGDVAVWDGRTAIVVAFPADDGGTLEVVVNGKLKPFSATEMSDSAGEFGQFVGFSHPHGIEATAPEDHDQGRMSGMPVTGDPSAGAAMPAVAAPA